MVPIFVIRVYVFLLVMSRARGWAAWYFGQIIFNLVLQTGWLVHMILQTKLTNPLLTCKVSLALYNLLFYFFFYLPSLVLWVLIPYGLLIFCRATTRELRRRN